MSYSQLRDNARIIEVVKENYQRHPEYLYAKLNLIELYLSTGMTDKIAVILDHKYDLNELYPRRNEFHVSEAMAFYGIIGRYQLAIHELDKAVETLELLKKVDPNHEKTRFLRQKIKEYKSSQNGS